MIALYPGSFDPPHLGHLDIIRRAAALVTQLVVAVASNPDKQPFLAVERRVALLTELSAGLGQIAIASFTDATVHFARRRGCGVLVRGLRSAADLERERPMACINRANGFDTLFLIAAPEHAFLSSSAVRLAVEAQVEWRGLVPEAVRRELEGRLRQG